MFVIDTRFWGLFMTGIIDRAILLASLIVVLWAFIHCARQRSDAFPAVGTLTKGTWLLIIAGTALLSLLLTALSSLFGLVALAASLIYLLDVRPAIRDAISGNW